MGKTYRIGVSESVRNIAAGWASPGRDGCHMAALATGAEVSLPGLWADVQAIIRDHPEEETDMFRVWRAVCDFVADYADWGEDEPILVCPRCGKHVFQEFGVWMHKKSSRLILDCFGDLDAEAFLSLPVPQDDAEEGASEG